MLPNEELYIISGLNKQSLILAKSIKAKDNDAVIIFTDCKADNVLKKSALDLNCTVTDGDIQSLPLESQSADKTVHIVLMGATPTQNLNTALLLTEKYRNKINLEIYTFNSSKASECLFDSIYKGDTKNGIKPVKLRRVNTVRNQIYTELLNNSIFDNAVVEYNEKIISVLIVGLGKYGMEMLKAVLWCGQMDGYVLRVTVIDKNKDAESLFYSQCPGIKQRGDQPKSGEDYYELKFYNGIDVNTYEFCECIKEVPDVTFAFVALGDEDRNLETSIKLRSLFSGIAIDYGRVPSHGQDDKQTPRILTVIHSSEKAVLINNNQLSNFKKQYYQIDCIGVDTDLYSCDNVFCTQLEAMSLNIHSNWGSIEDFNNYEYNRRSSMASAIHKKYRDLLMPNDETKDILEHKRWNAYMRSTEGYTFGYVRDDLSLRHHLLVKYDSLSQVEKNKDKAMNDAPQIIF
jgi:hypothetical protein